MTAQELYHTLRVGGYAATRCWEKEGVFYLQVEAPSSCHRCRVASATWADFQKFAVLNANSMLGRARGPVTPSGRFDPLQRILGRCMTTQVHPGFFKPGMGTNLVEALSDFIRG